MIVLFFLRRIGFGGGAASGSATSPATAMWGIGGIVLPDFAGATTGNGGGAFTTGFSTGTGGGPPAATVGATAVGATAAGASAAGAAAAGAGADAPVGGVTFGLNLNFPLSAAGASGAGADAVAGIDGAGMTAGFTAG